MDKTEKIVITGAAGLVGQNLVLLLVEQGYENIVALDKHPANLAILKQLNPKVTVISADLATPGDWMKVFEGCSRAILLHAQITSTQSAEFVRNNITATEHVLKAIQQYHVPYTVHISSSVVNSVAEDDYTHTKTAQENLVKNSEISCCILRPTLMFGWFDPKHLGWLARFMEKTPCFPIPGNGQYLRQPLYSRDFCRIIMAAMEQMKIGETYDIVGQEQITYIDIIKMIKKIKKLNTCIIKIPYGLFYSLLKIAALFMKKPPFTADQLTALTAGDHFTGVDAQLIFGVTPTPLSEAFIETFTHPTYSVIKLSR